MILDPKLSDVGRVEQRYFQKQYRQTFVGMRPEIETIFETNGQTPPRAFREVIAQLRNGRDTLIWDMGEWEMGKLFYDHHAETDASEATIKEFMKACPPFRALVCGKLMQWYDLAVRDKHSGERYKAGHNDLLMSVYLPYCDKFVTAEKNREQEKCLREVAAVAELETEILSYDDFCDSFLVKI